MEGWVEAGFVGGEGAEREDEEEGEVDLGLC